MKRFPRTAATANQGIAFVFDVVSEAGCIFRPVHQETDIGIDAYIEFVDQEEATGLLAAVQVKAGHSYLRQYPDAQYFSIPVSSADLRYWQSSPVPVLVIVYDPESGLSGWLDVTGHIRRFPDVLDNNSSALTIHSRGSAFDADALTSRIKPTIAAYLTEGELFEFADLVLSQSPAETLLGLSGLLHHGKSRFSRLTCYLLASRLFDENDEIRAFCSDVLSRYLHHPEVGYRPPKSISEYVENLVAGIDIEGVVRLLTTAALDIDSMLTRGSLGQSIAVIVKAIPDHELFLFEIASSSLRDVEVRWLALAMISEFELPLAIASVVQHFHAIDWGEAREGAEWIYENFQQTDASHT